VLKILKNYTNAEVFVKDTGVVVLPNGQYEITPNDFSLWYQSEDIVTELVAGNLILNDGEDDITSIRTAIGLIQDNQIITNEHYTLVQDDDVLVGNGQILYLNDDFDTTSNVPTHIDEQLQEDDDY
jgi:hypothetical protein